MIDIHCHILPNMDDGAENIEEACEMAYMAYQSGVTSIIATPHCMSGMFENYNSTSYTNAIKSLQQELDYYNIRVTILKGMEIYIGGQLELPRLLKKVHTINNSRYVLVEFNFDEGQDQVADYLSQIIKFGYIPIIAHPERYYFIQESPEILFEWKQKGYILQTNKGSILGRFGRPVKKMAHWMLDHDCIDIVASDAHGAEIRTPYMGEIYHYLSQYRSVEYANRLLQENPQKVIENKLLYNKLLYNKGNRLKPYREEGREYGDTTNSNEYNVHNRSRRISRI